MAESAALYDRPVERISFKGSVDAVRQYSPLLAQARAQKKQKRLMINLLKTLALDLVPERPGRREPRALKRRPKPYPLLTQAATALPRNPSSEQIPKRRRMKIRALSKRHSGPTPLHPWLVLTAR